MAVVLSWVAKRLVSLVVSRYRWVSRLMSVASFAWWLVARRRRRSAVVRLSRDETMVVGVERRVDSVRGRSGRVD